MWLRLRLRPRRRRRRSRVPRARREPPLCMCAHLRVQAHSDATGRWRGREARGVCAADECESGRGCAAFASHATRRRSKSEEGAPARTRRRGTGGRPHRPREGEGVVRRFLFAWVRIFGTKAEPQRIVATRPLCRVQHPVPHSSRLQGIHRVGPVTCDRVRLRPKLGVLAAERPTR